MNHKIIKTKDGHFVAFMHSNGHPEQQGGQHTNGGGQTWMLDRANKWWETDSRSLSKPMNMAINMTLLEFKMKHCSREFFRIFYLLQKLNIKAANQIRF